MSNKRLLWQEIQVDPSTVVWELKQQLFERRDGYAPGNSRYKELILHAMDHDVCVWYGFKVKP